MTGHLYELTDAEAATLAAAARILAERCVGSVWAVSLRGSSGIARLTVHSERENLVLDEALIGPTAARELAEAVREHNARRSAK